MCKVVEKNYAALPPFNEREILRYAGVKGAADENTLALLQECLQACEGAFSYRACYVTLSKADLFALLPSAKESAGLAKFLDGKDEAVLFAATVGLGVDRLIHRYASVSPVKALFFQAIGAERIETLCDEFCKELGLKKRFSPGYADFALEAQRGIFAALGCEKRLGISLTESLLMSPTKSVTAIAVR